MTAPDRGLDRASRGEPAAPAPRQRELVLAPGPWTHRDVSANGARFHVAECGDGPLVVLVHGFPEFWWAWRAQLPALADAGYRAVAVDLRGVGGSDKTPRGYDPLTLAADLAGVVRSLGESTAVVVGHGGGGRVAWTLAAHAPELVRGLAVLGSAHPLAVRRAVLHDPRQAVSTARLVEFQPPWWPERRLVADDAVEVERLLRAWAVPPWPDSATAARYRQAALLPSAAHCSLEVFRWSARSLARPDGRRWLRALRSPVTARVLHLHGSADPTVRSAALVATPRHVSGDYRLVELPGVGHFVHEEAAEETTELLEKWLREL